MPQKRFFELIQEEEDEKQGRQSFTKKTNKTTYYKLRQWGGRDGTRLLPHSCVNIPPIPSWQYRPPRYQYHICKLQVHTYRNMYHFFSPCLSPVWNESGFFHGPTITGSTKVILTSKCEYTFTFWSTSVLYSCSIDVIPIIHSGDIWCNTLLILNISEITS